MRTDNEQVSSPDPKRSKRLVLHKETIKNLEANAYSKKPPAPYPSACDCTGPACTGDSCLPQG